MANETLHIEEIGDRLDELGQAMGDDTAHFLDTLASNMGGLWLSLGLLAVVAAGLWLTFEYRYLRLALIKHLREVAIGVWAAGLAVYVVGYWHGGNVGNALSLVLNASVSGAEMFVSQSDLDNVSENCRQNYVYMTLFALVHFMAVLVSLTFVVQLMDFRLFSWVRLHYSRRRRLYVFWGVNENSLLLAHSIAQKETDRFKGERRSWTARLWRRVLTRGLREGSYIVFVKTPTETDGVHERVSLFSLFSTASHDRSTLHQVERMDALVAYGNSMDTLLENKKRLEDGADPEPVRRDLRAPIFEQLGLKNLFRAVKRAQELKLFFMSTNEMENITAMSTFRQAMLYDEAATYGDKQIDLYCHARRNKGTSTYSVPTYFSDGQNELRTHFIDSSGLSVLQLKKHPGWHPVNFVAPDTERGVATKPFTSMIVGFGETGRDAFKFLYEFGAFVGPNGQKNPFRCYAYDPDMGSISEGFYMRMPALRGSDALSLNEGGDSSRRLWDDMELLADVVDYIVVTLNDDRVALSLAANAFEYIMARRKNPAPFVIMVRNYHTEHYYHMRHVADYYNHHQQEGFNGRIEIFGSPEDVFSYDTIVDDEVHQKAKIFSYAYHVVSSGQRTETVESHWQKRRQQKQQGLKNHREVRCKEMEDQSNAWHLETKMALMGVSPGNGRLEALLKAIEGRDYEADITRYDTTTAPNDHAYPNASPSQRALFDNLAKCEHLRWNASMELMGYQAAPIPATSRENKRDYVKQRHACLVSCQRLESVPVLSATIKYDYTVTDVSLLIKSRTWQKVVSEL